MSNPQVTVVTPVHNAELYLAECIESVLQQTYSHWEYVIVNNCSTDRTLEIAERYARMDSRIRVVNNTSFVSVIENHNIAVGQTAPDSKYCKVLSADDWLFPECLARLVELAEEYPSVGIVGSYQLSGGDSGWSVLWDEIAYPSWVIPGREFCRSHLLNLSCAFGTPTSCLYRADIIRTKGWFYPHLLPHADDSAFYEHLRDHDFGFVHQVLSFWRIHQSSISAELAKTAGHETAALRDLLTYGPIYLTKEEYDHRLAQVLDKCYRALAVHFFNGQGWDFWRYHQKDMAQLGYHCLGLRLAKAVGFEILDRLLNPKQTIEKFVRRVRESRRVQRETTEQKRKFATAASGTGHDISRQEDI